MARANEYSNRKYGLGIFRDLLSRLIIYFFLILFLLPSTNIELKIGITIVLLALYLKRNAARNTHVSKLIKKRQYNNEFKIHRKYYSDIHINKSPVFNTLLKSSGRQTAEIKILETGTNHTLYDFFIDFYHRRWRQHKYKQVFGSVFEASLPRRVPHMIFKPTGMSHKEIRSSIPRNCNKYYMGDQILSRERNVKDDSSWYRDFNYAIKTYSSEQQQQVAWPDFLSSAVLQIINGKGVYHVEFVDENMFCYAALLSAERLKDFRQKCLDLHTEVCHNLRLADSEDE